MVPHNLQSYLPDQLESGLSGLAGIAAKADGRAQFNGRSELTNEICKHLEISAPNIQFQCLRVLANICADNDENRRLLTTDGFSKSIKAALTSSDIRIRNTSTIVVFNFCNDSESSQKFAIEHGLIPLLFKILDSPEDSEDVRDYVLRTLEMLTMNDAMAENHIPTDSLHIMLKAMSSTDFATFSVLLSAVLSYNVIQEALLADQDDFLRFCQQFEQLTHITDSETKDEAVKVFLIAFANISSLDGFAVSFESTLFKLWHSWIKVPGNSSADSALRSGGLILIGNLAIDDRICESLVYQYSIHKDCMQAIALSDSPQELHAAGGVLKNLSISVKNKQQLVKDGALEAALKLIKKQSSVQVIFLGLGLARLLISGSNMNTVELLESEVFNQIIFTSMGIYSEKDENSIKIAVARLYCALVRSISLDNNMKERLYSVLTKSLNTDNNFETFVEIILSLLRTDDNSLIGESVLALALISQSPEMIKIILDVLLRYDYFIERLEQLQESHILDQHVLENIRTLAVVLGNSSGGLVHEKLGKLCSVTRDSTTTAINENS